MVAYVVVEVDVHDPIPFGEYRRLGVPTISQYGGRVLARSDEAVTLEGEWCPRRIVVLEFADLDTARRWHASAEYQAAREIRLPVSNTRTVAFAGL
jgi:uncharacterized protein (DUF1330 family)